MTTPSTIPATPSTSAASPRAQRASGRPPAPASRFKPNGGKIAVFLLGLFPLARLMVLGLLGHMGANPIEFITRSTGLWALVWLCVTLAVTPARRVLNRPSLVRYRRMLGLFSFFYAVLHLTTYVWFDQWFDVHHIAHDIAKRPFILVGFAGFVVLLALALTSPKAMVKRLGRQWSRLHRLVYLAAILGVVHLWWIKGGKHDLKLPILYAVIVGVLLGFRALRWTWTTMKTKGSGG